MGLIKKLRDSLNKNTDARLTEMERQLAEWIGVSDTTGDRLSDATFYACRKVLSETIGKMPLKLMQDTPGHGMRTAKEHYLYNVVNLEPNRYTTATSFWAKAEDDRDVYGNAYIWIKTTSDGTSLWRLDPSAMQVWYDNNKMIADQPEIYYIYNVGGHRYYFTSEEIIHLRWFEAKNGIIGRPVSERLVETIDSNLKAQKLQCKMNDNGITPKLALHYTADLSPEKERRFAATTQRYADSAYSADGVRTIIPLPTGTELKPLNMSFSDAQFLELKQYTALQIASAFGIKPYQIGDYTKSSFASAEAQQLSFYVDTLLFIVKQYEEELTRKLLSDEEQKAGYRFKFNIGVILRADLQTQIQSLSTAVNSFIYTPNEARAMLDYEALPGGDRLLGNGASIPVEMTGAQYTKNGKEGENSSGEN